MRGFGELPTLSQTNQCVIRIDVSVPERLFIELFMSVYHFLLSFYVFDLKRSLLKEKQSAGITVAAEPPHAPSCSHFSS
jgi:hypothetical protein